ncbi:DUF2946 domain-containing protein [Caballeronia sp. dw_276]|jgi:hypothetical protein|uniref:DUF2946 domain-containing protein n=1 Tax=Caballeronia sp. dw_276 TaxID=2719795 RepID=UPI001BD3A0E6|nr:DUF2946 domain-containing protein [Caballeronia sp. dw_276]
MLSRFYRKIGSLLGLLAILMATLAPTASHILAANNPENGMQDEHCPMPSMQGSSTDDNPDADKHAQMSDGQDCAYCSLLVHMPAVPTVQALFAITVRLTQHQVATRFESVVRAEPYTFVQPRAPPVLS